MNKPKTTPRKAMDATLAPLLPVATKDRSAVEVSVGSPADLDAAVARKLTRPEVGSAAVIEAWSQGGHDVNALVAELTAQVEAVNAGQMMRAEGMLIAQAHTLDAIFVNLMRRAMNQKTMSHWDAYMRMGMKAQSQCRATLQALTEMKNPPVFARQANIANGPQQVNNGGPTAGGFRSSTRTGARTRGKAENQQIKLLEGEHIGGTYLDTGAAPEAARGNHALAAVGAVNRAKKPRGKGRGVA